MTKATPIVPVTATVPGILFLSMAAKTFAVRAGIQGMDIRALKKVSGGATVPRPV
jgi:hypothetical protein